MNWRRLAQPRRVVAFVDAWILCGITATAIHVFPVRNLLSLSTRRVNQLVDGATKRDSRQGPRGTDRCVEHSVWAISAAHRRVPGATCLVQALVGRILVARCGRRASIRIGVVPNGGKLTAHAWLELDGRVIVGGEASPQRFAVLPDLPGDVRDWR